VPFRGAHSVKADRVWIAKAVAPKSFDLPEFENLIPLVRAEEIVAIISGRAALAVILGHSSSPA
jgi:hypothetical protein